MVVQAATSALRHITTLHAIALRHATQRRQTHIATRRRSAVAHAAHHRAASREVVSRAVAVAHAVAVRAAAVLEDVSRNSIWVPAQLALRGLLVLSHQSG